MKSIVRFLQGEKLKAVAILTVFICLTLALAQTAEASGTFRVTAGVHVRSSPSSSASSLTTVNQDSSVDVIEHDPAGWSKVQVGSTVGYIRSDFLKLTIGETPASFRVTAGVHVRSSASSSANSLTTVNQDSSVSVLMHDPAGWSKVQVGEIEGYIRSDFLKHSGTASAPSAGGGSETGSGSVIGQYKTLGNVNLRSSASTSASVLKVVATGSTVDVLANESNGWSRVTHGDSTGYMRSDLLTSAASDSAQASQTMYATANVNLRTGASTSARIIRTVAKGASVEVIESSNGWSKAVHAGETGFMRSEYLSAAAQGEAQTRYTTGNVRIRARASTSSSILRVLPPNTAVTVHSESDGWSSVTEGATSGYISSELLSSSPQAENVVIATMRVTAPSGANVRTGPSVSHSRVATAPFGATVSVYANESNGWSRVRHNNTDGYIKSDLLGSGAPVELVTMAEISSLLPTRENIRVVDVRTGISYNIRIFSKGTHADYEPATRADTDTMFAIRGGVRSWSARPLWVYVGNRVFAAATHSMPHDVSWISDNGMNGHLCLHFHNTTTNSKTYQADLRRAVQEAYDKRPR